MSDEQRVAVVTGGNRGLGLETCRQLAAQGLRVVLASRSEAQGRVAAATLAEAGWSVEVLALDVADPASCDRFAETVDRTYGRVDVLVNNAGILLDDSAEERAVLTAPLDHLERTWRTNVVGPFRLCQVLVPIMQRHGYGRVVNVSSGLGQMHDMGAGYPTYSLSKAALNAFTRILADELRGTNLLVNSVCPGWVRTDMGGAGASRSVAEGAAGIVWAATLPDGGPTDGFFRDGRPIPW